ncbi:MAG TPA: prolyl oligopeptidase family serine peptidase, partial [Terriglobales bacterium]|nr:prolyl oligopeptidase family serine peptidase [Terriglobales bacterium]
GWAVVIPARRGRGGSDGTYDEGFHALRSAGYTCEPARSTAGADRALRDADAITDAIVALPFVDASRLVVGGQSRGGILSVAWAGRHPDRVRGVINFAGGWLGTGCASASEVNQALLLRGTRYRGEMLWLYSPKDEYYPLAHTRGNFEAFERAGGSATFLSIPKPANAIAHHIVADPTVWGAHVEAYLARRGLPAARLTP